MPIFIRKPSLDDRLQALADAQPARVTKHALAEALIERGIAVCDQGGNPEAWKEIGNAAPASVASAQQNTDTSDSVRSNEPASHASMRDPSDAASGSSRNGNSPAAQQRGDQATSR